jgi:hypothetical protein
MIHHHACRALVFLFFVVCTAYVAHPPGVMAESVCVYMTDSGQLEAVKNLQTLPRALRERVVCRDKAPGEIAAPEELRVGRDVRTADFATELGPMRVKWSRSVEACFGRSPSRAVSEAAQAVNRALKNGRFASEAKFARREWSLGFIDRAAAFSQFPVALTVGGHPGFMMPPNRIYIITDFVSQNCENTANADVMLTQVLLHEMGHVIEYLLLGESSTLHDRQQAEGFASWFEQYSADFTSVIPHGKVKSEYAALTKGWSPGRSVRDFSGSSHDYAVAALQFQAIVDRKGIAGLMKVYQYQRDSQVSFDSAVEQGIGWNRAMLERQMAELRQRG